MSDIKKNNDKNRKKDRDAEFEALNKESVELRKIETEFNETQNKLLNIHRKFKDLSKKRKIKKKKTNNFFQNNNFGGSNRMIQILLIGVLSIFLFNFFSASEIKTVPLSTFMSEYREGEFKKIILSGESATGTRGSGEKITTIIGNRDSFKNLGLLDVKEQGDTLVEVKSSEGQKFWLDLFLSFLPLVLIIGLMVYSTKGMKGMGGFPFGGKQKGTEPIKPNTRFKDVAGQDEAKYELKEIVEFLKEPEKFLKIGAKIPKGVLLSGPPGTGKTLLARAVAGESHVPFFSISGSEFVEMFVGVGASRVRTLFENARKHSPSIIFIDEIDAIGRKRSSGMGGGNDEREQTLNQILTEMDGFENGAGVIVIAATNRVEILDNALLRPGRFDRKIMVMNPTIKDREEILKVHAKDKPIDETISMYKIAARTAGFSGADLSNMLNEAAIFAARSGRSMISVEDIDLAIDRVTMGTEKKSLVMSTEEKKMTSYHEVGHALMAKLMPMTDSVHKITIVPRGMSLGATHIAPDKESYHTTKQKYFEELCVLLGGLCAEKIIFNDTTSGVSNDLERASQIANAMVKKFGMSEEIGPVVFFDPGEKSMNKKHSEKFAQFIDEEVQKIIKKAYLKTINSLNENIDLLHAIAKELIKKETLSREEFEKFFHEDEDVNDSKK
jgi:cell division protease FtsH